MESLQIRTGDITLQILDDLGNARGYFKFNPNDIVVTKKVMNMIKEVDDTEADFAKRAEKCETPEEQVSLLEELVTYYCDMIDNIYGAGTSDTLFGSTRTLNMVTDFFEGIMPYYQGASQKRMATKAKSRRVTKK